jgi:hypothetical protein
MSMMEYAPTRHGWAVLNLADDQKATGPIAQIARRKGELYLVPLRALNHDELRSISTFMHRVDRGELDGPRAAYR